ncbi:hypothetical protein CBM2592_B160006 [Cupriavidus taiwanensis]|nr:hypothetical protein CBM2592_B160006 [Cupriavidus taiwanensis]SOY94849.1 hypothetical protein CBM2591_B150006 [Cupriavidus taiwanensis]SOZ71799.1 hypothetical protein CBM2617_B180136 [Cupriavidus taiwanensis]SOZ87100.1 hypothetical protein CBM2618_B200132 [Cupriavidus taiwanensis]SOZ90102.1 hypothetical protein CBM2622_B190135 [Cupriavidus taiwanensis]
MHHRAGAGGAGGVYLAPGRAEGGAGAGRQSAGAARCRGLKYERFKGLNPGVSLRALTPEATADPSRPLALCIGVFGFKRA